jgi:multidrug transporter EmrE-like cation transporter
MNLIKGMLWGLLGQIFSFMQLQGSVKYGWFAKYPILILLSSIPAAWFYIKSVEHLVTAFDGQLWPSRLIGFGIGIVVFVSLSILLFKEPITAKTLVCLGLALSILGIQIFWK